MSLLDALKDPTMQRGLLELGLRLMSTPGKTGQAIGQAGLGAIQGMNQYKAQEFQTALQKHQLEQMERQKLMNQREDNLAALPGQYTRPATQEMQGNNPSAYMPAQPAQIDLAGLANAYMAAPGGLDKGLGLQDRLRKQGPTAHSITKDGKLVFTDQSGRVVSEIAGETSDNLPSGMRMGANGPEWIPSYLEGRAKVAKAGAAGGNTMTVVQEKEESKAVGKYLGEQYADLQKEGMKATGTMSQLRQLSGLLNGVNTGKLTPAGTELAAYAKSLGLNVDDKLGNKQAADALMKQMALEMRNPSGGAGMPGAMSDADREYLTRTIPNLSNDPEGNRLMIDARMKLAQRSQKVAELARKYRMKHGSIDDGFLDELKNYSDSNPLFSSAPIAPAPQRPPLSSFGGR